MEQFQYTISPPAPQVPPGTALPPFAPLFIVTPLPRFYAPVPGRGYYLSTPPAIYGGKEVGALEELLKMESGTSRLLVCAALAAGAVYLAEKLCAGRSIPLWEKYGPWITANRVQAIAIAAAVLYAIWLALAPEEGKEPPGEPEYRPCE